MDAWGLITINRKYKGFYEGIKLWVHQMKLMMKKDLTTKNNH